MIERNTSLEREIAESVRKRNIQAVLGLLKMKNDDGAGEHRGFRAQKNEFQRRVLRDVFKRTRFPSKETRDDLALLLSHTNRGIQIWFQNQRNSRDDRDCADLKSPQDRRNNRNAIDILTLAEIIENNLPHEKRYFWERFINYVPHFY